MSYKAFISYKHGDDDALARQLEKALEKFAKPTFKRRAIEIFRDGNDLSAAADLGEKIRNGLATSEFFVCLASPKYAQSKWCCREAEYWRDYKPVDNLLIVLTDGEILWDESTNDFDWSVTTAIPKELSGYFKGEPFYIDFRNPGPESQMTLDNPDFKTRLVLLAATLHGKSVGDMVGEAVKQHKRTLLFRNAAVGIVMALMSVTIILTLISNRRKSASLLHFQAKAIENSDPSLALRLEEEEALEIYDYPEFKQSAFEIIKNNTFYKILKEADSTAYADMAISAKDGSIVLAGQEGVISILNAQGDQIHQFKTGEAPISSIDIDPNTNAILVGTHIGAALWDVQGNKLAEYVKQGQTQFANQIRDVDFSPDGQSVLLASANGAHIYSVKGDYITTFKEEQAFKSVVFAPSGEAVLLGYDGHKLAAELVDLEGQSIAIYNTTEAHTHEPNTITNTVAFSGDGQTVLICSHLNNVQLHNVSGYELGDFELSSRVNYRPGQWQAALSYDGSKVLISSFENVGQLYDRKGVLLKQFKGHDDQINIMAFHPNDQNVIITGSADKTIRKWYAQGLQAPEVASLDLSGIPVNSLDVSPNDQLILVSSNDDVVRLFNTEGEMIQTFDHGRPVEMAEFSPGGSVIVVSSDHLVQIWDLKGQLLQSLESPDGIVHKLSFTPNSKEVFLSFKTVEQPQAYYLWYINAIKVWKWSENSINAIDVVQDTFVDAHYLALSNEIALKTNNSSQILSMQGDVLQELDDTDYVSRLMSASNSGELALTSVSESALEVFKSTYSKTHLSTINGDLIQEYSFNTESVVPIGFADDSKSILTLSYPDLNPWNPGNPIARLWDLEGNILLEIHRAGEYITDIEIFNNGEFMAVGFKNNWNDFSADPTQHKIVIYRTVDLYKFLESHVAPISKKHRQEYHLD